jgi:hypothetical protein
MASVAVQRERSYKDPEVLTSKGQIPTCCEEHRKCLVPGSHSASLWKFVLLFSFPTADWLSLVLSPRERELPLQDCLTAPKLSHQGRHSPSSAGRLVLLTGPFSELPLTPSTYKTQSVYAGICDQRAQGCGLPLSMKGLKSWNLCIHTNRLVIRTRNKTIVEIPNIAIKH